MNTISWELLCTCIMHIYRTHGLDIQLSVFVMATGDAKLSGLFTWSSNSVMLYTCIRCGYNISEISRYVQQYCHRENKTLVAKFNGLLLFVIKIMLSVYCSAHSLSESSVKTITTPMYTVWLQSSIWTDSGYESFTLALETTCMCTEWSLITNSQIHPRNRIIISPN